MSRSSTVCVDASIVVRHVASTVDAEIAALWSAWHRTGTAMVSPSLLHYEVVNALHQYMARGVRTAAAVTASLRVRLNGSRRNAAMRKWAGSTTPYGSG